MKEIKIVFLTLIVLSSSFTLHAENSLDSEMRKSNETNDKGNPIKPKRKGLFGPLPKTDEVKNTTKPLPVPQKPKCRFVNETEKQIAKGLLVSFKESIKSGQTYDFIKNDFWLAKHERIPKNFSYVVDLLEKAKDDFIPLIDEALSSENWFVHENRDIYITYSKAYVTKHRYKKGAFLLVWCQEEQKYRVKKTSYSRSRHTPLELK